MFSTLELKSLSSIISNDGTLSGDNIEKWVNTHTSQPNSTFTAILAPGTYNPDIEIMQLYVNGALTPLKVKTKSTIEIESGKAYNFNCIS